METLIKQLFKWDRLRKAIFEKVDFYNSIKRILADPEDSRIVTAMWCDKDGWRGWTIRDNVYFFHDFPEKTLGELLEVLTDGESQDS